MSTQTYQVFISSTSVDLNEYRQQIIAELHKLQVGPLVMEYMGSYAAAPVAVCDEYVVDCDIFIGVYAFRYGFVPGEDEHTWPDCPSITEQEFNAARRLNKRCICYFADDSLKNSLPADDGPWAVEKQRRLAQFKQNIHAALVCAKPFTSPEGLRTAVSRDLNYFLNGGPLGYTRTDVFN